MNDIRSRLDKLHVTVLKIYTATCHPEEIDDNSIGIQNLPLASLEAFNEWENFNLDEEKKLIVVKKYFLYLISKISIIMQLLFFCIVCFQCVTDSIVSRTWQRRFERFCILYYAQTDGKQSCSKF